jgi:uncharacterized membrane protein YesL
MNGAISSARPLKTMKSSRSVKKLIFEGGIHHWLIKLFDAIVLNLLWFLFCIPLITIGASSAAFYHCFAKILRSERGHIIQEFWKSFTLNLGKGILLFIGFALIIFILIINRNISNDIGGVYISLFFTCFYTFLSFVIGTIMLYAITVLSRFEMSLIGIIKLSVFMCFRYLPSTLILIAITSAVILAVYYFPPLVLFLPVFFLYPFSLVMEKVLIRHTPGAKDDKDEKHKWYFNLSLKDE